MSAWVRRLLRLRPATVRPIPTDCDEPGCRCRGGVLHLSLDPETGDLIVKRAGR